MTAPTPARRSWRPHASGTSPPTRPTTSAVLIGSPASSTVSSSWNLALSPLHNGAPSPVRPALLPGLTRSVGSDASRSTLRRDGSGSATAGTAGRAAQDGGGDPEPGGGHAPCPWLPGNGRR